MRETRIQRMLRKNQSSDIPETCTTLEDVKKICKFYGIQDSVEYRERYKNISGLPAHPDRVFKDEWVSYFDLLDIPQPYLYEELKELVRTLKLISQREYKSYLSKSNDPRMPKDPQCVYGNEWENWYRFLGKEEPYKVKFISKPYEEWGFKIEEFMKVARGGGSKITHLCRFVRHFIECSDLSKSPQAFLTKEKVNIKPFRKWFATLDSEAMKGKILIAINEFLDFVIENDLTMEDEETGEVLRVMEARNPLALLTVENNVYAPTNAQTTKPCLQHHFVKKAQDWIVPKNLKCFSDLKHLQMFDSDWVKVPTSRIDRLDPDCVFKKIGKQYFLWSPVDWIHTYALTCVPLRGRQIAYNDSGEADELIAETNEQGDIVWIKNNSLMSGMTKNQSFIKKMPDGQLGMFITTNKTSNHGNGYSIPWIPSELAYWLVKLRKWQQKYNPISKPTSWTLCKKTNLNENQLKAKGINCFLFREFNSVEPKNVSVALTTRLAAALYYVQPSNLELSTLTGRENVLSHYKSKYTPHSMRVSLITAYIMELGMPIEVVMKIVGHSSIVMSIYYCKVTESDIRHRLEESEKIALKSKAESVQRLVEENNLEEVKNQLVSNNSDMLMALTNSMPAGNFMFRDYGICPYAASRCDDGGEILGASQVRAPVPAGYLGMQNCLRCRHFISGPAFLGGLLSLTNEILLQSNIQSSQCAELQSEIDAISERISELERKQYIADVKMEFFDNSDLSQLEFELRKLESEYESSAKKMDMYLCDLQASYKLIQMCQSLVDDVSSTEGNKLSLVKMRDADIEIDLKEVSYFQQLQEVCENASIFKSASAVNAVIPRSQLLDRMSQFNQLAPQMFLLSPKQQLDVGNQLVKLMLSRLKSWERVNEVVGCKVRISELVGSEKIEPSEIELITNQETLITGRE